MRKKARAFCSLAALLLLLPLCTPAMAAGAYDAEAALRYAKSNWNNGRGGCLIFAGECLRKGGVPVPFNSNVKVSALPKFLINNAYGTLHTLAVQSEKDGGAVYVPRTKENGGTAVPGDLLLWYCEKCKEYIHVGVCGRDVKECLSIYAHNFGEGNQKVMLAKCPEHGGAFMEVRSVHMAAGPAPSAPTPAAVLLGKGETLAPGQIGISEPDLYRWKSGDTAVAAVSSAGAVTAKSAGETVLTAEPKAGGKPVSIRITVKKAPAFVLLDPAALTLRVGESARLASSVPEESAAFGRAYSSNLVSVAKVDAETGLVTGVKAGRVMIKVQLYNGKQAVCAVTVRE